jgi:hypothetical protein
VAGQRILVVANETCAGRALLDELRSRVSPGDDAVGDSDPVQAIEDALFEFDATQIVISTHPRDRSNWLEKQVVSRATERFAPPITHVVVDLAAEREGVTSR